MTLGSIALSCEVSTETSPNNYVHLEILPVHRSDTEPNTTHVTAIVTSSTVGTGKGYFMSSRHPKFNLAAATIPVIVDNQIHEFQYPEKFTLQHQGDSAFDYRIWAVLETNGTTIYSDTVLF